MDTEQKIIGNPLMKNPRGGLIRSSVLITFFSVIGIAINFISQLIIAYYFGAKFERDAYFVAVNIPLYVSAVFTGSIGIIFLPKFIEVSKNNEKEAINFLSSVFWLSAIILIIITLFCIYFSEEIIHKGASGFNYEQVIFTSKILIIIIPSIIFTVLSNLLSSLYQINHKFLRPAISPLIGAIISLLFVTLLSQKFGILGLAIGYLVGSFISFAFLLPILKNVRIRLCIDYRNPLLINFLKKVIPLFLTGFLFRSTTIFERMIASKLSSGSISFLGYSNQILLILATLTSSGIAVVIYTKLSLYWSDRKLEDFNNLLIKSIRIVIAISLPIIIAFIFFGDFFIEIVFERGAFTSTVTDGVYIALACSMGAFIFQNIGNILVKVFYISGRTSAISLIASLEILIYLILGVILSNYLSFIGLSIALSVSSGVNIIISTLYIRYKILKVSFSIIMLDIGKIILSLFLSIIIVYSLYFFLGLNTKLLIFVSIAIGFIFYFIFGTIFRIEEFLYLKDIIKNLKYNYGRRN